ncbi:MAG: hypothetical protein O7B99_01260, partial [Planctomycetota bacterium]|nr:hypothetical protein [Planctomycetota bacterium]
MVSAIPYEELARDFLALYGLEEEEPGAADFETVLASRFVALRLGALDVRFPTAALADRKRQKDFQTLSRALVTAQVHWLDWIEAGKLSAEQKAARKDAAKVDSWIKGWKGKWLAKIDP